MYFFSQGGVRIAFTAPDGKFDPSERVDISKEIAGCADVIVTDEACLQMR